MERDRQRGAREDHEVARRLLPSLRRWAAGSAARCRSRGSGRPASRRDRARASPRRGGRDRRGKLIGTHFAGPTWQAKDGSKVVGARVDGVNVDPTAIDWLLLSAASTAEGPRRGDLLADTTFIQRVNTTGGLIPAASTCNASTVGTTSEVPYTADYYFWKARRPCREA